MINQKYLKFSFLSLPAILLMGCEGFTGCIAKEFMQDTVKNGLTRLFIVHASMITQELNREDAAPYSFEGPRAKRTIRPSTDPKEYGKGEVTWELNDVDIFHEEETEVYADCTGRKYYWQGKAHINNAKRVIYGTLTGDQKNPVLPDAGKISIYVDAKADDLQIRISDRKEYLKIYKGDASFTAKPRLGVVTNADEPTKGLLAAQTSNLTLADMKFANMHTRLFTADTNFAVPVEKITLYAQIGIGADGKENFLEGEADIWGNPRNVPTDGKGVDPDYDRADFEKTFSCRKEFAGGGVSYKAAPLENRLGAGAAGLSTLLASQVLKIYKDDQQCGMASAGFVGNTEIKRNQGGAHGSVIAHSADECLLDLNNKKIEPDCLGYAYELSGKVKVIRAKKEAYGLITIENENAVIEAVKKWRDLAPDSDKKTKKKDMPEGVIPHTSKPGRAEVSLEFLNAGIKRICTDKHSGSCGHHCERTKAKNIGLENVSGRADVKLVPKFAKVTDPAKMEYGLCAGETADAEAEVKIHEGFKGTVLAGDMKVSLPVDGLFAIKSGANKLSGGLNVWGRSVLFKKADQDYIAVDDDFNEDAFKNSFLACPDKKMKITAGDHECSIEDALKTDIARLLVLNAGMVLKAAENMKGGFKSINVVRKRVLSNGNTVMTLTVDVNKTIDIDVITGYTDANKKALHGDASKKNSDGTYQEEVVFVRGEISDIKGTTRVRGNPLEWSGLNIGGREINLLGVPTYITQLLDAGRKKLKENTWQKIFGGQGSVGHIFVKPNSPDSHKIHLSNVTVYNFISKMVEAGKEEPEGVLYLKKAQFEVEAIPLMALNPDDSNAYTKQTKDIKFEKIIVSDASANLQMEHMNIPMYIEEANIKAFMGSEDYIEGSITFTFGQDQNAAREFRIPRAKLKK